MVAFKVRPSTVFDSRILLRLPVSGAGYFPAQTFINEVLYTFSLTLTHEADLNILERAQWITVFTANAKLSVMESGIRSAVLELRFILLSFTLAIIVAAIIIATLRFVTRTIIALSATMMSSIVPTAIILILTRFLMLNMSVIIAVVVVITIFAVIITATARFAWFLLGFVTMIIVIRRVFIAI